MIPENKKTKEELSTLRGELGISGALSEPIPPPKAKNSPPATQDSETSPPAPASEKKAKAVQYHSLRKSELPLAPASPITNKTVLPSHRHGKQDIAEMRRRDVLTNLPNKQQDTAEHLTAHPILLVTAYLLALGAAAATWQRALHLTPLALIVLSILLTIFIFLKKKRSRHHAAILTFIIVITLAFGGIYYAPLFSYAT